MFKIWHNGTARRIDGGSEITYFFNSNDFVKRFKKEKSHVKKMRVGTTLESFVSRGELFVNLPAFFGKTKMPSGLLKKKDFAMMARSTFTKFNIDPFENTSLFESFKNSELNNKHFKFKNRGRMNLLIRDEFAEFASDAFHGALNFGDKKSDSIKSAYDINNAYGWIVLNKALPVMSGRIVKKGNLQKLQIIKIEIKATLKKGKLRTIFGEEIDDTLTITSIDLALIVKNYDIKHLKTLKIVEYDSAENLYKFFSDELKKAYEVPQMHYYFKNRVNSIIGMLGFNPRTKSHYHFDWEKKQIIQKNKKGNWIYPAFPAFVAAWQRWRIDQIVGDDVENVVSIITDAIYFDKEIKKETGTKIGELKDLMNVKNKL